MTIRNFCTVTVSILLFCSCAMAANTAPDTTNRPELPATTIIDHAVSLQTGVYPVFYADSSASLDMRWVSQNDTDLVRFWHQSGDSVLSGLSLLSGLSWRDETLPIYFIRYYPTMGSADPVIMPICGLKNGPVTEAIPRGSVARFSLIYLLAERLIETNAAAGAGSTTILTSSPLARPGAYFRDNLALLLAYSVSRNLLGPDSTSAALGSPYLKSRFVGREFFEKYLRDQWVLMPDKPLLLYLSGETEDSKTTAAAYSIAANSDQPSMPRKMSVEGLPTKGQLGFSVRSGSGNQLIVASIDSLRIAYKSGLRKNDIIRSVNGQRVRQQRELMEAILDNLETGATLQVSRNDKPQTLTIRGKAK